MTQEELRLKALELARDDMRGRISTHEEMLTQAVSYENFLSGLGASMAVRNSKGGCDPFRHSVIISLDKSLCSDRCSTIISIVLSQLPDQVFSGHSRHEKSPHDRLNSPSPDSSSERSTESVADAEAREEEAKRRESIEDTGELWGRIALRVVECEKDFQKGGAKAFDSAGRE